MAVVARVFHGVHAVGKDAGLVGSAAQERQTDGKLAWRPVGHGGHIPRGAFPSCHHGILAQLPVYGDGLVESRRHLCDEVGAFLLALVGRGTVGQHLQGCFKQRVHGHLVDSRALAHRVVVVAEEVVAHGVGHGARRVVHRSAQHAQIGRGDVVAWLVVEWSVAHARFPFRVLQSLHALEVHHIGKGPLNAERLQPMQVEQQVVSCCAVGQSVGRGDDFLVIAVEEVHLEALHAAARVVAHHRLGLVVAVGRAVADEVSPARPQDDAHALLLTVGYQAVQVDGVAQVFHERLLAAPALVDDDVLQVVPCGEVYII